MIIKLLKTSKFWQGLLGLTVCSFIILLGCTVGIEITNFMQPQSAKILNLYFSPLISLGIVTIYWMITKSFPILSWGSNEEYKQLYRQSTRDAITRMYVILSVLLLLFVIAEIVISIRRNFICFEMIACIIISIILMRTLHQIKNKEFLRESDVEQFHLDEIDEWGLFYPHFF